GASFFLGAGPIVEQAVFFSGGRGAVIDENWWTRPYPGFFTALLTPLFGVITSALLVNWLSWAVCAWATWQLSKKLFDDDFAALLAVVFASGGLRMVFPIGAFNVQ